MKDRDPRHTLVLTHAPRETDREAHSRPLSLRLILRIFGCMQPFAAKRNALLFFVGLRAIQLPLIAWSIAAIINGPIAHRAPAAELLIWVAAIGGLMLFTNFCFHYRYRLALELGEAVINDLQNRIYRHLQAMPMSYFSRTRFGRIISRMTSDCEAIRVGVQDVFFVTLVGVGQMLVSAALMACYDLVLFAIVLGLSPVLWQLNRVFRKRLSRAYRNVQESFSRVTATLAESVNGIRIVQSYMRQEVNAGLFGDLIRDHASYNMRAARTAGVFLPLLEFKSQLFLAALLLVGGYRALQPETGTSAGDLVQFFFLASVFFGPIQILGNQYNQALTAMAGAERVFELLDTPITVTDLPTAKPIIRLAGRVEFRDVSFGYAADRPVLHRISFVAEPGTTVALVGATGSGKSTITNLLTRFYEPDSGEILFDGRNAREITLNSLRSQFGIVPQNNFLYSTTVMENIRFGRPSATDAEIREAARQLDCLDLLDGLPQGLQTRVGERGNALSLGERQLVCFVRALIADPRILILDEATSAVDSITELRIQTVLKKLIAGRTTFAVAHRLSTIRDADLLLVLDHGRIIEHGSHFELLALNGKYAAMHRQAVVSSAVA